MPAVPRTKRCCHHRCYNGASDPKRRGTRQRTQMTNKKIDATVTQMQHLLEREYASLEWRVLVGPPPTAAAAHDPLVFVHARTRDFRFRCRVSRPWAVVRAARSLRGLVADVAAEAEQLLADQAAAAS